MKRWDKGLAYMLQFEHVAWYEDGAVRILDRRIYPIRTEFVICHTYEEVAIAIRDMVTQSEGPYTAAAMGMALAGYQLENVSDPDVILAGLNKAAYTLSHARPTTSAQMQGIVYRAINSLEKDIKEGLKGKKLTEKLFEYAFNYINGNYQRYSKIGRYIAEVIPDNGTILTQCFPGTIVGTMLREVQDMNKDIKIFCAETRPYYQGSRLTASVACDMGFDVTVICDNMPGYTMRTKNIDLFTSASDVITMDGHVVNKVGTYQIALAANAQGIPYYCTGTPDPAHPDMSTVVIEERDPELVMESLGTKITMDGVKGYYPAFDDTPPELVTGIVTDKGIYKPEDVSKYFEGENVTWK